MVASKNTVKDVIYVLENWRMHRSLSGLTIADLLDQLSKVKGNKSFTDTMKIIKEKWDKWEGF